MSVQEIIILSLVGMTVVMLADGFVMRSRLDKIDKDIRVMSELIRAYHGEGPR